MSSGEIERATKKDLKESLTEVEFALVLSRIISSVTEDQEQLRHTIYDLARYKLKEQLRLAGSVGQPQKTIDALEARQHRGGAKSVADGGACAFRTS